MKAGRPKGSKGGAYLRRPSDGKAWADVAEASGIPRAVFYSRRARGMSNELAAIKPLRPRRPDPK